MRWIRRLFGGGSTRRLARYEGRLAQVERCAAGLSGLSDGELTARSQALRARVAGGTPPERVLPEAFALVREASGRVLGMRHYDVQLLGGMALYEGCVAEMKTGEGKTLVATLPAYLHALSGGVHVVTVNDYLAQRDSLWMGPVYRLLGLSVGLIQEEMGQSPAEETAARQAAYACDVTYATNHELCFDFLRDNLAQSPAEVVHRGFDFALVDEVDFLLIDEARTPLIISGPTDEQPGLYNQVDRLVRTFSRGMDYYVEEKTRAATLSDHGLQRVQDHFGVEDLTELEHLPLYHAVQKAILAHGLFRRDVDYLLRDGRVLIVDEFTGRVSEDKRYADGLHQALEAKEGVEVKAEDRTLAKVSYQTFFSRYRTLAGMTGTAWAAREELLETYGRQVVVVPTHRKVAREDYVDVIFSGIDHKHAAVVEEIQSLQAEGRPVLVGTTSVAESERLAALLRQAGVEHRVLNAKNHGTEAALIAQAGQPGAVTISTNMAGRGVDIALGGSAEALLNPEASAEELARMKARCEADRQAVRGAGGLHVIGTGHHESARIDQQLRGRAGRQGDPGSSQFFISLEDELYRKFGQVEMMELQAALAEAEHPLDEPVDDPALPRILAAQQKKVEEENRGIRREVLKYDLVIHVQRESIYAWRKTLVDGEGYDPEAVVRELVEALCETLAEQPAELEKALSAQFHAPFDLRGLRPADYVEAATARARELMAEAEAVAGSEAVRELGRRLLLEAIDDLWTEHLTNLERLEEGIGLQGYAQIDPVVAWRKEAGLLFGELLQQIRARAVDLWFLAQSGARQGKREVDPTQAPTDRTIRKAARR